MPLQLPEFSYTSRISFLQEATGISCRSVQPTAEDWISSIILPEFNPLKVAAPISPKHWLFLK
jgi:hypothetical protein